MIIERFLADLLQDSFKTNHKKTHKKITKKQYISQTYLLFPSIFNRCLINFPHARCNAQF